MNRLQQFLLAVFILILTATGVIQYRTAEMLKLDKAKLEHTLDIRNQMIQDLQQERITPADSPAVIKPYLPGKFVHQ